MRTRSSMENLELVAEPSESASERQWIKSMVLMHLPLPLPLPPLLLLLLLLLLLPRQGRRHDYKITQIQPPKQQNECK